MATNRPFEFFIQWHLTEQCNLSCRHCYQEERAAGELPLSEIRKTIVEASDMISEWSREYGISFQPSMNVTGGEPFLRRDLFDVLALIKLQGFEVYLLTNGTLIDEARARRLAEIGVDGVQVSIEGGGEVHDAIRGNGSFAAAAAGIERLVDCGLDVTINVTVSNMNASEVQRIIAFGSRAGVRRMGFSRLVPGGKGKAMIAQMLAPNELETLYRSLVSRDISDFKVVTGDPVAAEMKITPNGDAGNIALSGCAAGISGLTIQPNGNVMPCRRLPLTLGNVLNDSLREIWATSPVLEALRDRSRYRGKCGSCRRWARCRGCRAIAYASSQARGGDDFLADDPQCFLE